MVPPRLIAEPPGARVWASKTNAEEGPMVTCRPPKAMTGVKPDGTPFGAGVGRGAPPPLFRGTRKNCTPLPLGAGWLG